MVGLLIITVIAAVITPTPDIPSMMIIWAPMAGLYTIGVGIFYLVRK